MVIKKIIAALTLCVTLFLVALIPVSAAGETNDRVTRDDFEKQSCFDDISSTRDLQKKYEEYSSNAWIKYIVPEIVYTMEFGYFSSDLSEYGFYIYLFDNYTSSKLSGVIIQMSLGEATNPCYSLYNCELLSKYNCFSKWKVDLSEEDLEKLDKGKRVYEISGVTCYYDSAFTEFPVGTKYVYTGNLPGYGSEINTLACNNNQQDIIELQTNFTYYRTAGSSKGLYWQNQINTVYFSVPNKYIDDYGELSAIHHKYTEYQSGPMVVTDNEVFKTYLQSIYDQDIEAMFSDGHYALFDGEVLNHLYTYTFNFNYSSSGNAMIKMNSSPFSEEEYDTIPFFFYNANLGNLNANDVSITSEEIFSFMNNHSRIYFGTYSELEKEADSIYPYDKNKSFFELYEDQNYIYNLRYRAKYWSTFFEKKLDEYDATMDFRDSSNIKNLLSYNVTHDTWDKILDFGLWDYIKGDAVVQGDETISNIHPLAVVSDVDINLSDSDFAEKYLVNVTDSTAIKQAALDAEANDCTLFLFRFDISDYYAKNVELYKFKNSLFDYFEHKEGYNTIVCLQSYYDDFDIISLTFEKNGTDTIIPVVHTPQDFIGDITTPSAIGREIDWSALIGLALGSVLLIIFRKPLAAIVGGVAGGVSTVGKGIFNGIRRFFKRE